MRADFDLPWFFGTGPSTAQGDSGLRCSLGSAGTGVTPSVSALEDMMIRRVSTGTRIGDITDRLESLSRFHQLVLRLHYGTGPLAFGVSGAAVLCRAAWALLVLDGQPMSRERLNAAMRGKGSDGRMRWVEVEAEAATLVAEAVKAYEAADVPRRRKVWAE